MKNSNTIPDIKNYEEFWPYYLKEHSNRSNRILHYLGTSLAIISLILICITKSWVLLFLPLLFGYGLAWIGHFFFQKNKPATFKYPWWSLISDFRMFVNGITQCLKKFHL